MAMLSENWTAEKNVSAFREPYHWKNWRFFPRTGSLEKLSMLSGKQTTGKMAMLSENQSTARRAFNVKLASRQIDTRRLRLFQTGVQMHERQEPSPRRTSLVAYKSRSHGFIKALGVWIG